MFSLLLDTPLYCKNCNLQSFDATFYSPILQVVSLQRLALSLVPLGVLFRVFQGSARSNPSWARLLMDVFPGVFQHQGVYVNYSKQRTPSRNIQNQFAVFFSNQCQLEIAHSPHFVRPVWGPTAPNHPQTATQAEVQ